VKYPSVLQAPNWKPECLCLFGTLGPPIFLVYIGFAERNARRPGCQEDGRPWNAEVGIN